MNRRDIVLEKRFDVVDFYRTYNGLPEATIKENIRTLFLLQAIEILEKEIEVAEISHIFDKENGEKIFRIHGCISFD